MLAFAHRGGAYHPEIEGLENTIAAFRHAVELGYRYLETDVHLTADGILLAFHDDVLDRVTDTGGDVASMTLEEVRRARVAGREEVPTLAQLFAEFPGVHFNIDLKGPGTPRAMAEFIEEHQAWERVFVASFSRARTREFRRLTRGLVPTAAHPGEVLAYRFLPSSRLVRLVTPGRPAALQIPHRRGPLRLVTPALVRRARANGVQVHVWTVDEPSEMVELIDRGVDGIFTDRTDLLKEVLVARGQW